MVASLERTRTLDLSIAPQHLPLWVYGLNIIMIMVPLAIYCVMYSLPQFLSQGFAVWQVPAALALIVLHELVHAISWKYASGLPWSDFKFGIIWKALTPYCHATSPMNIRAYRFGAALPLLVTGMLPWLAALAAGDAGWTFVTALLIGGACGDLYVLWTLRDIPSNALVQDHPSRVGCIVYLPA
jgi:hypothetical protein